MSTLPLYRSKPRKMKRDNPEARLQRAVVQHLKLAGSPGLVTFKIANEGKRSVAMGAEMKRQGLIPGAADLCMICGGKAYFLELKAKGGKPTDTQLDFGLQVTSAEAKWDWADNINQAITILRDWGLLQRMARAA